MGSNVAYRKTIVDVLPFEGIEPLFFLSLGHAVLESFL
jgi:hypothetical protein